MAKENNTKEEPIETQLWKVADKLRKNIDAAEYKHIVPINLSKTLVVAASSFNNNSIPSVASIAISIIMRVLYIFR
jgi:hypothetical protein